MTLETKYKGRDYSEAVEAAIQRARTEYEYPTSNASMGMREVGGRGWYAQLLKDELSHAKVPLGLKKKWGIKRSHS